MAGRLTGCCPEAHFEVQNPGCEGQNPGYEGPMSLWVVFIPNLRWSSIGLNELLAELDRTSIGSRVKTSEFVWWFQCSAAFFSETALTHRDVRRHPDLCGQPLAGTMPLQAQHEGLSWKCRIGHGSRIEAELQGNVLHIQCTPG